MATQMPLCATLSSAQRGTIIFRAFATHFTPPTHSASKPNHIYKRKSKSPPQSHFYIKQRLLITFFEKNEFLYVNSKEYFITLQRIIDWLDVPHLIHNQSTDYMVFNDLVENLNL